MENVMPCKCGERVEAERLADPETGVGYWRILCPKCERIANDFTLQDAIRQWLNNEKR